MAERGVQGLEIAPGMAFAGESDAFAPSEPAVAAFRRTLERHGLELVSMQSLLFGVKDARLFGTPDELSAFERGMERAISLAGRLGVPNLVFGSPANRVIPEGFARTEAEAFGAEVLRRLGDLARANGCVVALEPNPAAYGTNFLNTMAETMAFADKVDHPAVSVNFDIGALLMNGDFAAGAALFARGGRRVSHVHVSEPNLAPAPASEAALADLAGALLAGGYGGWFSIEMRQVGEHNLDNVRACLDASLRALRPRAA